MCCAALTLRADLSFWRFCAYSKNKTTWVLANNVATICLKSQFWYWGAIIEAVASYPDGRTCYEVMARWSKTAASSSSILLEVSRYQSGGGTCKILSPSPLTYLSWGCGFKPWHQKKIIFIHILLPQNNPIFNSLWNVFWKVKILEKTLKSSK